MRGLYFRRAGVYNKRVNETGEAELLLFLGATSVQELFASEHRVFDVRGLGVELLGRYEA